MKMQNYTAGHGCIFNTRRLESPTAGGGEGCIGESPIGRIAELNHFGIADDA